MTLKTFTDLITAHPYVTGSIFGGISLYGLSVLGVYHLSKRLNNYMSTKPCN